MTKIAPRTLLGAGAVAVVLTTLLMVWLALQAPQLGLVLVPDPAGGVRVAAVQSTSLNATRMAPGTHLLAINDIELSGALLVEEPDTLGTWSQYNDFMARQTAIVERLWTGGATALRADGDRIPLAVSERQLNDLPVLFWFQILVGGGGFLVAVGVVAFRPDSMPARYFALAGLGFLIFASAAAVYSTREAFMDGGLIHRLSMLNHFGALLFTAALVALLWYYPGRLGRWPMAVFAFAFAGLSWSASYLQWAPEVSTVPLLILTLFSVSFVFAFFQWRATRGRAVERAALKWYLLSIYLGTGLFAVVILLPGALGSEPIASQGLMFAVFLIMFIGIAFGITRYRLFELDRWWFRAWTWFIGGVAVIFADLALVSVLNVSHLGALALVLAVLGWVWFPLRQWAWSHFTGDNFERRQARFGGWVGALTAASDEEQLYRHWRDVLRGEFNPLEMNEQPADSTAVQLAPDGQWLRVPNLRPGRAIELRHADSGARLFSSDDRRAAEALYELARHVHSALGERERVVAEERQRIMRDLHDDLGAKLLSLTYLSSGEGEQLARGALQDMRDILSALGAESCTLEQAMAEWHREASGRVEAMRARLAWSADPMPAITLSARQRTNIGRILREAITNAFKHGQPSTAQIRFTADEGHVGIIVENDGGTPNPEDWCKGTGTRIIAQRARDIGGNADWETTDTGVRLSVVFPFVLDASSRVAVVNR